MQIKTAGELRGFLAEVMVGIREGSVKPDQANAISKIAAQINQSIACEVNTALQLERMGKPGAVAGSMLIASQVARSDPATETEALSPAPAGTIGCEFCNENVPLDEARACKARHCPVRSTLQDYAAMVD